MKKKVFLPMIALLFAGQTSAQNVSEEQMDERFYAKELPYGWFTEG